MIKLPLFSNFRFFFSWTQQQEYYKLKIIINVSCRVFTLSISVIKIKKIKSLSLSLAVSTTCYIIYAFSLSSFLIRCLVKRESSCLFLSTYRSCASERATMRRKNSEHDLLARVKRSQLYTLYRNERREHAGIIGYIGEVAFHEAAAIIGGIMNNVTQCVYYYRDKIIYDDWARRKIMYLCFFCTMFKYFYKYVLERLTICFASSANCI